MKRLKIDAARCSGCNSCVLTCSVVHERLYDYSKSRIRVQKDAERAESTPKVCIQCDEAPCVSVCPVGALSVSSSTGAVEVKEDVCTGCRLCVTACPYDGIAFDEEGKLPLICDLCGGDPACVSFCQFTQAIRFEAPGKESV
jgi:carbon-monoxide dehydrogenase iron sulfur subunit